MASLNVSLAARHTLVYLTVLAGIAACGSSNAGYSAFGDGGGGGGGGDGTVPGDDSGSGSSSGSGGSSGSSGGGGACPSTCTTDQDCQNGCPAPSGGGLNCCDVGSGTCMLTTQSTCPAPADGGAE
jgi:hypothetical protein